MNFGKSSAWTEDRSTMSEINVTPLVDVMLVLLIVFMITMPVLTHSIELQLPTASVEEKKELPQTIRFSIDVSGQFFIEDRAVTSEQLEPELKLAIEKDPETILAIAADKNVAYQYIADAMAMAQKAGISKIGFITEQEAIKSE